MTDLLPVLTPDLLLLAAGLLATGIVAGILSGLLGVGGGIVIVPVLYHIFTGLGVDEAVRMHVAVGTSLATIIPTSISSSRAHRRKGSIDDALLKSWVPSVLTGVVIATLWGTQAKGWVLTAVFAVVALAVAANMTLRREGWTLTGHLPTGWIRHALGATIGSLSALMGIGGGTLSVPVLSACSYPIHRAVGTASALGLVIAVPGTIGFLINGLDVAGRPPLSLGFISLPGLLLILPTTILAAPWGVKLAHVLNGPRLRQVFAFFLFLTSLRMIYALLT